MAIDYGDYARLYGGGTDLSPLTEGISKAIAGSQEARKRKIASWTSKKWEGYMKSYKDMAFTDVSSWGDNPFTGDDVGKHLAAFKADALAELDRKTYTTMEEQGHFNPLGFKQNYDAMAASYTPMIETKLETYQDINQLGDKNMKEWIAEKGLNKFLLNHGHEAGEMRALAMPDETWGQWWQGKSTWGKVGIPAATAGTGYYVGKKLFDTLKVSPDKFTMPGMGGREGPILGSKKTVKRIGKALPTPATNVPSQDLLDRARSQYKSMQKTQGGPGIQTETGKRLKRTIKNLETRAVRETKRPLSVKGTKALWKKLTTKYGGHSGVIKALVNKVGKKKALAIGARLGLGAIGTVIPEAFSTAAGVALTGYTIYQVANMLLGDE